jgi:hypothetical protein
MPQGFVSGYPPTGAPINSLPLRTNLDSLFGFNSGSATPVGPLEGTPWVDTSDLGNIKLKMYVSGAWRTIIENLQSGGSAYVADEIFIYAPVNAGEISSGVFTLTESLNFIDNALNRVDVFVNGVLQLPLSSYYTLDYTLKQVTFGVDITLDVEDILVFAVKKLIGTIYNKTTP